MPRIVVVSDALIDESGSIKFLELQQAHHSGSMLYERFKKKGIKHNIEYTVDALRQHYEKVYIFCPDYIAIDHLSFFKGLRRSNIKYQIIQNLDQIDKTAEYPSVVLMDKILEKNINSKTNFTNYLKFQTACFQLINQLKTISNVDVYFQEGLLNHMDDKLVLAKLLADNENVPKTSVWERSQAIPDDIGNGPKIFKLTNSSKARGSFALEGPQATLVCEMIQNLSSEEVAKKDFNGKINKLPIPHDAKAQLLILLNECAIGTVGFTMIIQDYVLPALRKGTNLHKQFRVTATVDTKTNSVDIHHMVWVGRENETGTLTQNIANLGSSTGEATQQAWMAPQERSELAMRVEGFLLKACKKFANTTMNDFIGDLTEKDPVIAKVYVLSESWFSINLPESKVADLLGEDHELLLIDKLIRANYQWDFENPAAVMVACAKFLGELDKRPEMNKQKQQLNPYPVKTLFFHQIYAYLLHDFKEKLQLFEPFDDENIIQLIYGYIDRLLLRITLPFLNATEGKSEIYKFRILKSIAESNLKDAKDFNQEKNLGLHYLIQSQYSLAIKHFEEALSFATHLHDQQSMLLPQARTFIAYSLLRNNGDNTKIASLLNKAYEEILQGKKSDKINSIPIEKLLTLVTAIMYQVPEHEKLFPQLKKKSNALISYPMPLDTLPVGGTKIKAELKLMVNLAKKSIEKGNYNEALEKLTKLIELFPKHAVSEQFKYEVLLMRADIAGRICFAKKGDYELMFKLRNYIHAALKAFDNLTALQQQKDWHVIASLKKIAGNSNHGKLTPMSKTIHIPQGRVGQLSINTKEWYDIEGLYTEGFSSCNIIIGLNSQQLTLIHVDAFINDDDILEYLQGADKIVWIYKQTEGETTKNVLLRGGVFKEREQDIIFHMISPIENIAGVHVSFNGNKNSKIHPNIKLYSMGEPCPLNLLRHPDEHKFTAVQKISQIIGMRAVMANKKFRSRTLHVFNNYFWASIDKEEFNIDDSHPLTKDELALFNPQDPFVNIDSKLEEGIVKKYGFQLQGASGCDDSAYFLESYLNDFSSIKPLKQNLLFLINFIKKDLKAASELAFFEKLLNLIHDTRSTADDIQYEIDQYSEMADSKSEKLMVFFRNSRHYFNHYHSREATHEYVRHASNMLGKAKKLYDHGKQQFDKRNYPAALELFQNFLSVSVCYGCVDNPKLASGYYYAGRAAHQLKQYSLAIEYLDHAFSYRHYGLTEATASEIQQVSSALDACRADKQRFDASLSSNMSLSQ